MGMISEGLAKITPSTKCPDCGETVIIMGGKVVEHFLGQKGKPILEAKRCSYSGTPEADVKDVRRPDPPKPKGPSKETIDGWYEEARSVSLATLGPFLDKILKGTKHSYDSLMFTHSIAALAAVSAVEAHFAHPMKFMDHYHRIARAFVGKLLNISGPFSIRTGDDMLYPQNKSKFTEVPSILAAYLKEEATRLLKERKSEEVHPEVREHWERLAKGELPFGFTPGR